VLFAALHHRAVGIEGITGDDNGKSGIEFLKLGYQPLECCKFTILLFMAAILIVFKPYAGQTDCKSAGVNQLGFQHRMGIGNHPVFGGFVQAVSIAVVFIHTVGACGINGYHVVALQTLGIKHLAGNQEFYQCGFELLQLLGVYTCKHVVEGVPMYGSDFEHPFDVSAESGLISVQIITVAGAFSEQKQ
jgi:hypothetical protein